MYTVFSPTAEENERNPKGIIFHNYWIYNLKFVPQVQLLLTSSNECWCILLVQFVLQPVAPFCFPIFAQELTLPSSYLMAQIKFDYFHNMFNICLKSSSKSEYEISNPKVTGDSTGQGGYEFIQMNKKLSWMLRFLNNL